jgi:hypothetical protein
LVAAKFRERLSVSKRVAQMFEMQRFDLRKLDDAEVKEKCQVKIVALGGIVVSVLARPRTMDLKGEKIRSKVKPLVTCRRFTAC